jgi:hypothetical protein
MKLLLCSVVVAACGSSGSNEKCSTNEVEVDYLGGGARDNEVDCMPIPGSCGSTASCSVMACIHDLYGYCDSPYIGVGCSDTFAPTIVSCNP